MSCYVTADMVVFLKSLFGVRLTDAKPFQWNHLAIELTFCVLEGKILTLVFFSFLIWSGSNSVITNKEAERFLIGCTLTFSTFSIHFLNNFVFKKRIGNTPTLSAEKVTGR